MIGRAELDLLILVLKKMHIPVRTIFPGRPEEDRESLELGCFLGLEDERINGDKHIIHKLTDPFRCRYLALRLRREPEEEVLVVGPYTTGEITREEVMEAAERLSLPTWRFSQLESHYTNVTVVRDEMPVLLMVISFAERVWGSRRVEIVDSQQASDNSYLLADPGEETAVAEGMLQRMKQMERRYAYENELMELVSQGHHHRAELMLTSFSGPVFEQRTPDPIRNIKNYSIICNTLLRKAAERGGVHPIYLDELSSHFARRIEGEADTAAVLELLTEMVRAYCRLVQKQAAGQWSPTVQKAVAYIEANLAGDLSLRTLAGLFSFSPGYLSTIFRKETGKTLTEYVSGRRMETGAHLLRTTNLQVQTIAQHCGIADVNYFSKLFKKFSGMTPKQYRQESQSRG